MKTVLHTLAILICGTSLSCAQFLINPYTFGGGGGGSPIELFTGYTGYSEGSFAELGFSFTPTSNITITHLGAMFVAGSYANKTVSLRQADGTLIESALIPIAGITAGVYYWTALITPRSLTSGTEYIVTMSGGFNPSPILGAIATYGPHITGGVEVDATGTPTGNGAALPSWTHGTNLRYTQP